MMIFYPEIESSWLLCMSAVLYHFDGIVCQELESVAKELATLEGHIREVTAQIDPLKQARASAKAAHSVRQTSWS